MFGACQCGVTRSPYLVNLIVLCSVLSFCLSGYGWDATVVRSTPRLHGEPGGDSHQPFAPSVQALAVTQAGVLYAGSFGMGMFRSDDQGMTWMPVNIGLTDHFFLCLAVDAQDRVYAGTVRGGVFRTKADGQQWEEIGDGLKRVEVKSFLIHSTGVFAGTGRGVYRWNESTKSWSIVAEELDQLLVASLAMIQEKVLLAATAGKGLFRYDVSGETASTWQGKGSELIDPKERLHHRFLRIVATDKRNHIFLGTQDGGIFRSTDQGNSWHTISRTLPNDSIRSIVSHESNLYVGTGRGIYKLDSTARRWIPKNTGLADTAIQTMIVSPDGVLYAGTSAGAFRSDNDGTQWVNISEGLGTHTSRSGPF
ncbi:MAG: ligand-binding sensor domain-containing protein [Nitrospirales bacterium]